MKLSIQDLVTISLALQVYEKEGYQIPKFKETVRKVDSELKTQWAQAHSNPY